jgi:serine/threonine-protein kinase
MDERGARRLELVKQGETEEAARRNEPRTSSGVIPSPDPKATLTSSLEPGQLLEGKYLVGKILGAGAVGIVYEAKNVELDETVAIKCLRPEMAVDSVMVGRFAREAKAAAAIKSEYVATVHDVGTTPQGMPFMVMEYLDGKDLASVVEGGGPVGPRTAVEYALQVCEALAVAHSKGIVHRDIKPENLLLTERAGGMKIVKVLDFGISKAALTGSIFKNAVPLVKTVNLMGTPLYMSPEQVRATDSVDVRSDVWSLGMVIYEMLTGHTAFDGQTITEICAAILEAQPRPIEMYRNDLPSGLVEVISKCLQKDVTKRYQTVAELALALMPFGPKRTRLNVERAVAVLQAAGQLGSDVQVNSTVPPSPTDFMYTPIPKAPAVPSDTSMPPAPPSSGLPLAAPSSPASGPLPGPSSAYAPPEKKKPFGLVLGALAVVAILIGSIAAMYKNSNNSTAAPPPPTTETRVAPPEAKASPPASVAATPSETPADVPATPTQSGAAVPAVTPHASAPRPALLGAPRGTAPARPKASAKPGEKKPAGTAEEPDMGY